MSNFKKDIVDWVSGRKGGHVQHWLYTDNLRQGSSGSELFAGFARAHGPYYIYRDEIHLISNCSEQLAKVLDPEVIADFGVGDFAATRGKVMPIIKGLRNARILVGVDLSTKFLKAASDSANSEMPSLIYQMIQADFHGADPVVLPEGRVLGLLLGCSVTNQNMLEGEAFPASKIIANLKDFKRHLGRDSDFIVTYDANSDPASIKQAYNHPKWAAHVTGIMKDIQSEFSHGGEFDASAWHYEPLWDEGTYVLHQCVVSDKDQSLTIDDVKYDLPSGTRLVAVNNFKFPTHIFRDLCVSAGFEIKQDYSYNTLNLQHLRT